jgi:hypothetical protein
MPVILAVLEVELGKITIRGQPCQKVGEMPSQPIKLGVVTHARHPAQYYHLETVSD